MIIVEPLNNKNIGTHSRFFKLFLEVFFIERYKSIEEYANGTLGNKFIMRWFFTVGGVHYRRFHCIFYKEKKYCTFCFLEAMKT